MGSTPTRRARRLAGVVAVCAPSLACSSLPPGRSAVDSVDFEGVRHVGTSDLSEKIATAATPRFLGLFEGIVYDYELFDPYVLEYDLRRVERYYRAQGYYEAHARAGRIEETVPGHVRVHIVVDEGPPVLVDQVRIVGVEGLSPEERREVGRAVARAGLVRGERFVEDDLAAAEWQIRRALENRGYAYVHVERSAEVDLPHRAARATFTVAPDLRATFGAVTIRGLGSLPEGPVRTALDIKSGERYSADALDAAQRSLLDLGVFSSVVITPERTSPPPADRVVPIVVDVSPSELHSLRLGGGLELDVIKTELHASAGWTDANFGGGLRRFEVNVLPGVVLYPTRLPTLQRPDDVLPEVRTRLELRQPGFVEAHTQGYLRGAFNVYPLLITPNTDPSAPVVGYREARGTAGVSRTFGRAYADFSYNLQYDAPFAYLNETPDVRALQAVLVSYVDLITALDLRDSPVRPHKGVLLRAELQAAGGVLQGTTEDIRVQPEARAYAPLGHATLAARATTGLLFPGNYTTSPPPGAVPGTTAYEAWANRDQQLVYFRGFFSGGPTSNRGYPIFGVGPHGEVPFLTPALATEEAQNECVPNTPTYDPTRCAVALGGATLWESSLELRVPLSAEFDEATFCDASDVETGLAVYRFQPHLSCGVGLRYQTPVGPIRLDVAYRIPGLNPRPGDIDYPGNILGLPIGVALGIGEAY